MQESDDFLDIAAYANAYFSRYYIELDFRHFISPPLAHFGQAARDEDCAHLLLGSCAAMPSAE